MMDTVPLYFRYWGKAERDGSSYHLLPYHCLDVAAVGHLLLMENAALRHKLSALSGLDETICCLGLKFFLTLHDMGKFSESFQNLRNDLLKKLQNKITTKNYSVRHDSLGNLLWYDHLWDTLTSDEAVPLSGIRHELGSWEDIFRIIIQAFCGHHGKPPDLSGPNAMRLLLTRYFGKDDLWAADAFTRDILILFSLTNENNTLSLPFDFEERMQKASWLTAGFVVLCDWIGSNSEWFTFHENPMALADYWENHALPQARQAISAAGIGKLKQVHGDMAFAQLFPTIARPTPLQLHVSTCRLHADPQLFIIEDVTGSGKTEAALLLAGRLMVAERGNGLFVALPTMATSNAMYERMIRVYHRLYAQNEAPSLVLAHAARHLSASFMASVAGAGRYAVNEETATAQCTAWLADNRKKALLADVGVGTIDQALLAVLPARFQSLRLFGLSGHILIVDEVHAYDPYMNKLLQNLLTFHAALGGSAILLSATLPRHIRDSLVVAFARGCDDVTMPSLKNDDYPMVTAYGSEMGLEETGIAATPQRRCRVAVRLVSDQDEVEHLIVEGVRQGKCVCWIRNTVHDALEGHMRLTKHIADDKLMLFHARFAMGDRLEIENRVTTAFGRESGSRERNGMVLVATQVVEQSLDLDFDLMVSDLAPMDLLIQRAGRFHRHLRDENGNPITQGPDRRDPSFMVIHGPVPEKEAGDDWYKSVFPKAAFVYPSHGCLWLTARLLTDKGELRMPDDARELIEVAFSEHADTIPQALQRRDQKAEAQWQADKSLAHINMLKLDEGYTATINQWREDMKTPTRLGAMETTVRLAQWDGTTLTPWYADGYFRWDMSQVNLRGTLVDTETEHQDKALSDAVVQTKERLPDKGKYSVLVPLSLGEDGCWRGHALNKNKSMVVLEYDRLTGLRVSQEEE
jgi:CRISPR-associated endonuclease/helicase Cas3